MPKFDSIRKKIRRRRIETVLLAGYAFAVTCALFISLLNKSVSPQKLPIQNNLEENYDFTTDVLTPAFNDSSADNPFETAYTEVYSLNLLSDNSVVTQKFELVQNNQKEQILPIPTDSDKQISGIYQKERRVLVIESGDTFIGILNKLGMDNSTATEAYNVFRKVYDARNLKIGQHLELTATFDVQSRKIETLDTLVFEPELGTKYILRVNEYDQFEAKIEQEKFAQDVKVIKGSIVGQASVSMVRAGIPQRIVNEVVNRMSHLINFKTDLHKGDKFAVKYEVSKTEKGDVVKTGKLLYAEISVGKRVYKQYRFKDEFYDEKGQARKTGLDIKPMAMRNARISSLIGYRTHPIYKTKKFHSGVDYAAPSGTAIYASGNGVVEMAQYVNGYGNFVKIRHNSEYETAYGHMKGFARGIRKGIKVRKGQIIGYVGSTGRSTGPHLHFEIIRKGQRINPLKAKVATGNDLTGGLLSEFKRQVKNIDAANEKIQKKTVELGHAPALEVVSKENNSVKEPQQNTNIEPEKNNVIEEKIIIGTSKAVKKIDSLNEVKKDDKNAGIVSDSVIANIEAQKSYEGKTVYPPKITASQARLKNVKTISVPQRKPKYAKR